MAEARARLVDNNQFVPIPTLERLGRAAFNRDPDVYLHYPQAMALTVFLMDAQSARFRPAFLDYVEDAYDGRLRNTPSSSLAARLQLTDDELKRLLLQFLQAPPD
jgi:hypothetical protein